MSALRLPFQCMHEIQLHVGPILPRRLPPPCNPIICSGLQAFSLTRCIPRLGSPLFLESKPRTVLLSERSHCYNDEHSRGHLELTKYLTAPDRYQNYAHENYHKIPWENSRGLGIVVKLDISVDLDMNTLLSFVTHK